MLLLELANKAIFDALADQLAQEQPGIVEFRCSDFDGAMFHVWTSQGNEGEINISLSYGAAQDILEKGGMARLQKIYGPHLVSAENGYDVTLQYSWQEISQSRDKTLTDISMIKAWVCASPLLTAMESAESGGSLGGLVDVALRDSQERMWIVQDGSDRITVLFSVYFRDPDDMVFAKVFFQEFKKSMQGAPSCDFNVQPPGELRNVQNLPRGQQIGYVTFVVFDRHFKGGKKDNAAFTLTTFRNYLHYHIKCSKSHMHTRMRNRTENLLKIINRAKQEPVDTEKKTATGRTFVRK
jgi:actin related protein 2/3 complex subunit 2